MPSIPGQLSNSTRSLPFNRSGTVSTTQQIQKHNGINTVTPFLDLNLIYGITVEESKNARLGSRGKLKTSGSVDDSYPLKDPITGKYVTGLTPKRPLNIFTMSILTIWLREHNRLCDQLYELHGESWSDDQYFDEAVSFLLVT